jgi:hypothetical protein
MNFIFELFWLYNAYSKLQILFLNILFLDLSSMQLDIFNTFQKCKIFILYCINKKKCSNKIVHY